MRVKRVIVYLLLSIILAIPLSHSFTQPDCVLTLGEWVEAAPAPENHLEGATAVVNDKLYIFTGFKDNSLNVTSRVDVYNPEANIWETVASPRRPVPVPFSHAQAAVDGTDVWFAGGFVGRHPGPATDAVWKYDTVNDLWYQGPSLPAKRAGGLLVRQGRYLHYAGGTSVDRDRSYSDHWRLNLDELAIGWVSASDFPQARIHVSGAYLNGLIYAIGGQFNHDHDPIDLKFVHAFDITTGQWSRKADLPFPRSHFEPGTVVMEDRIIIVGGRANQNGFGFGQIVNVTEYNAITNTWRELTPLPVKLIAPVAARIGDKLIVTNGGVNWNTGQKKTYISQISYSGCSATPTPPTATELPTETPIPPTPTWTPELPTLTATPTVTETPLPSSTPNLQRIESFTLINAITDQPVLTLQNGSVVDCKLLGTSKLNIRADTVPEIVGSVRFGLNGNPNYVTENGAPYAIGRNNGTDYNGWTPPNGSNQLTATPYTLKDAAGYEGISLTITFTATNCSA
jgi:hypothetical protein